MVYAAKIKKNPRLSVAYESDAYYRGQMEADTGKAVSFGAGQALVLLTVAATIVWTVWGVVKEGYYIPEIASQFFVMGLVSGIIEIVYTVRLEAQKRALGLFQMCHQFRNEFLFGDAHTIGTICPGPYVDLERLHQSLLAVIPAPPIIHVCPGNLVQRERSVFIILPETPPYEFPGLLEFPFLIHT